MIKKETTPFTIASENITIFRNKFNKNAQDL